MRIEARRNQTLFDLSLQLYGKAEGAFALATENDTGITDELSPGQALRKADGQEVDSQVQKYYSWSGTEPATAVTGEGQTFEESFSDTFQ